MKRHSAYLVWLIAAALILIGASAAYAQADSLDYSLTPVYGDVSLQAGFTPDPQLVPADPRYDEPVETGYDVDVAAQAVGRSCVGYTTSAPTYRVYWTGTSARLRIFFKGEGDTTLIINDPRGWWLCNDDSYNTAHPSVSVTRPPSGQYDIWVGTFSPQSTTGVLTITEMDLRPGAGQ